MSDLPWTVPDGATVAWVTDNHVTIETISQAELVSLRAECKELQQSAKDLSAQVVRLGVKVERDALRTGHTHGDGQICAKCGEAAERAIARLIEE